MCACACTAKAESNSHHENQSIHKRGEKEIISNYGFMDMAFFKLVWESCSRLRFIEKEKGFLA